MNQLPLPDVGLPLVDERVIGADGIGFLETERQYKIYSVLCCLTTLKWTDQPTNRYRQRDRPTDRKTDGQTERDRQNTLIFRLIWTRVNLTICQKITKFTKLQLLHYFVIDTHQLVWVAVVETEAPVVSHECEVGFP